MIKLVTFLLMFGATQVPASPNLLPQETATTQLLLQAGPSEVILGALFDEASEEWGSTQQILWNEYRNSLLTVKKLGTDPTGEEIYELNRLKTGGSLILILDVQAL